MNLLRPSFLLTFIASTIFIFFVFPASGINTLSSMDTIEQTCTACAEESKRFDRDFCLSSLRSSPQIHPTTDLPCLAITSMVLAIENATATKSTIQQLLVNDSSDTSAHVCLQDCLVLYENGKEYLAEALIAFMRGDTATANVKLSAAMEAAETCDTGFKETGIENPLQEENYCLSQLSGIALCITKMLSSRFHDMSS